LSWPNLFELIVVGIKQGWIVEDLFKPDLKFKPKPKQADSEVLRNFFQKLDKGK
jgi:hypothetical protein